MNVLVRNPDGILSLAIARVKIMATWHFIEPTTFFANGGSSVTIHGTCLPAAAATFVFTGISKLFAII